MLPEFGEATTIVLVALGLSACLVLPEFGEATTIVLVALGLSACLGVPFTAVILVKNRRLRALLAEAKEQRRLKHEALNTATRMLRDKEIIIAGLNDHITSLESRQALGGRYKTIDAEIVELKMILDEINQ